MLSEALAYLWRTVRVLPRRRGRSRPLGSSGPSDRTTSKSSLVTSRVTEDNQPAMEYGCEQVLNEAATRGDIERSSADSACYQRGVQRQAARACMHKRTGRKSGLLQAAELNQTRPQACKRQLYSRRYIKRGKTRPSRHLMVVVLVVFA